MSSRFNPSNTPRKPPPWCLTAVYKRVTGMLSPMPTFLNAVAEWNEPRLTPPVRVYESFCLKGDGSGNYYSGSASAGYYSIHLQMSRAPATYQWEIELSIYHAATYVDHESWHAMIISPIGLFDSGRNWRYYEPPPNKLGWQAIG